MLCSFLFVFSSQCFFTSGLKHFCRFWRSSYARPLLCLTGLCRDILCLPSRPTPYRSPASLSWEGALHGVIFRAPGPSGLWQTLANEESWQEVGERDSNEFGPFLLAPSLRGHLGLPVSLEWRSQLLSKSPAP